MAARRASGARVLIVHSAVSGITDRLERLLDAAIGQAQEEELRAIEERHRASAPQSSAVPLGEDVERHFAELREIAAGVALVGEVSERTRARVMASGELMATHIGARFLRERGLDDRLDRCPHACSRPSAPPAAPAQACSRRPATSPPMRRWRRSCPACRRW